jgi:hypothetical protein
MAQVSKNLIVKMVKEESKEVYKSINHKNKLINKLSKKHIKIQIVTSQFQPYVQLTQTDKMKIRIFLGSMIWISNKRLMVPK